MSFLDTLSGMGRVSRDNSFDFNTTSDHTLFSVPTGLSFIPTLIVIHSLTADMASARITAGKSDAKTDFVGELICSGIDGVTKVLVARPDYAGTPAAGSGAMTVMAAGETFVIDMTVAAGSACVGTVDLFGLLF